MKIKDLISDVRTYIVGVAMAVAVVGTVLNFWKLPSQVQAIAEKVYEVDKKAERGIDAVDVKVAEKTGIVEDKVQQLANTVDKFIAVQAEREKAQEMRDEDRIRAQEKREELMLKLIEQMSKDGR